MSQRLRKFINHVNHFIFDGRIANLHYPPKWVTIGITGYCTYKCLFCCSHCPDSGQDEKTNHQYKIPHMMEFESYQRIVNMCVDAKVPHIHICGMGEPFIHPEILPFIDYLTHNYPHDITLQTDFSKAIFNKHHFLDEIISRQHHIRTITTDIFPKRVHESIKVGSDFEFLFECMERISRETSIKFNLFVILTKKSYKGLVDLLVLLNDRGIHFDLILTNLFPFGFNEFTSKDNIYFSDDTDISKELEELKKTAKKIKKTVRIPPAWDVLKENASCNFLWQKVQLMPTSKIPKEKWSGNAIPFQCPAVVRGRMFSVGNLLEHENFMSFWNNDMIVGYRKRIIEGRLPDDECETCCYG